MQHITSRKHSLVARCRDLARGATADLLLLDGFHLVSEACETGIAVRQAIISAEALDRPDMRKLVDLFDARGTVVVSASASVMGAVSQLRSTSDIVAIAEPPVHGPQRMYAGATPFVVIAADVQDPGNLGAIIRVAEAGGAAGMLVAGGSAHPWGWKALRGSMGSAFRLPIDVLTHVAGALAQARQHRCRIVAAIPAGGQPHVDVDLLGPVAIVIGGEGPGLSPDLVDAADLRVTIPMAEPVESLNVAVAAALLIYEARRQRHVSAR
jgi:TrmH family RNA methyltransferase